MGMSFQAIEIEINSKCNRTCWYCPNSNNKRLEEGEMEVDLFIKLMEQLQSIDYKGRVSYHFYGEPLLCSHLDLFVELTKKYLPDAYLKLYSNGDYLNDDKIVRLINEGIDEFVLTKHVGNSNYFYDYEINKLPFVIKKRITYRNHEEIESDYTNRGGLVKAGRKETFIDMPCERPNHLIIVTLQGNILPCCEDYMQQEVMGNIRKQHIIDIWNSKKYIEFRENLTKGKREISSVCRNCNSINKKWDEEQQRIGTKNIMLDIILQKDIDQNAHNVIILGIVDYFVRNFYMKKEVCTDNDIEPSGLLEKYGIVERGESSINDIIIYIRSALSHHYPTVLLNRGENKYFLFWGIDENKKVISTIGQFDNNEFISKHVTFSEIYQLYNAARQCNLDRNDDIIWEYFLGHYE